MSPRDLLRVLAIAFVYAALGRLGQAIALEQVTAVWPPSGVALAAVLLFGPTALPGVWLGSFVLNAGYLAQAGVGALSVPVGGAMAAGAMLEPLLVARLVRRWASGPDLLDRAGDVFRLALAALLVATIPATIGTAGLVLPGLVPASRTAMTWWTWWLGDTVGILVVTPLLLTFGRRPPPSLAGLRGVEAALLLALVAVIGHVSFFGLYPLEYTLIPCLVWAAFRFGTHGATLATVVAATVATWGTALSLGPFVRPSLTESLLLLQAFLGVVAMTALVLCAVLDERRQKTSELVAAMEEAREARAAAEDANQAKGIFLANMGHEVRTPLNHIIGYSDLLAEEAVDQGAGSLVADIRRIESSARQLLSILHHILELAQLGTRKLTFTPTTFPLEPVVNAAAAGARARAEANGNRLEARLDADLGAVTTDAEKLRESLDNLLENACKFTRDGAVTLLARRETVDGRDWIVLAVSDTGIGMDASEIERVFRAFTQAETGPSRRFGGAGLGLAVTRRFCQLMGGDVTAVSEPGKGSTFTMRLPADGPAV